MLSKETNKKIIEYVDSIIRNLNNEYNIKFSNEKIQFIIQQYINKDNEFEVIKNQIDIDVKEFILKHLTKDFVLIEKEKPFFGQVYKNYVINVLKIYDEINDMNINEVEKREQFKDEFEKYMSKKRVEINNFLSDQTDDMERLAAGKKEMFLGAESLNYDTVKNLYNTFINDINIVSNDFEGKMYSTVINHQQIFNEDGHINKNIIYNFDMIKETYDFAKKNGKSIKFHTFLWHNSVPENLKNEVEKITDPNKRKEMVLEFLNDYATKLSNFMKENNYDLRQIEALNEIANDTLPLDGFYGKEGDFLRKSWWRDILGDKYYIDTLKILKRNFPNTEIIYNEYNEFLPYKTDRIVKIIEEIRLEEENCKNEFPNGILDGIGLQAHLTNYHYDTKSKQGLVIDESHIIESAKKIQTASKGEKIYITEYDFLDIQKNDSKNKLENVFFDIYSKIANGFITWGNSDSLTWFRAFHPKTGENTKGHLISSNGEPKKMWKLMKEKFYQKKVKNYKEDIDRLNILKEQLLSDEKSINCDGTIDLDDKYIK